LAPVPRLRPYGGPAILSYGFRPFFFLGAIYAGLEIALWLPIFFGITELPTAFSPRDWHVHEMLYGYLPAVMTGFLLTAIPNWTGRMTLQGKPLLVLVAFWLIGRLAMCFSALIGPVLAAIIDTSFLVLIAAVCAREILTGRNWRNLPVLAVLSAFIIGNASFHTEYILTGTADFGIRIGIAAALILVMLIGGRIVPSFTRNWLVRQNPGRLPAHFARFDVLVIAVSAAALVLWISSPESHLTGSALLIVAALHTIRLARWAGDRTYKDRLVLVLHVAYAFVPLGFLLVAAAAFGFVAASAGIHSWTAGAIGMMTLAVMTRASLGHTGRALAASALTHTIYAAALLAAIARICAALEPRWFVPLLVFAGLAWTTAFWLFGLEYGPILFSSRTGGKVGQAKAPGH
jgi:uncharacterized protein involved in response to NO